ncbi:hypothetical protein HIM_12562 [Hirsutella minnesotensis 3608]|uniref:Reverse transcriptase domain-containing protein n=1 Tax=Hirsutella minnesotensis 3608 TaxID=1043627 RepID=A0A0F7ZEV4_9HYPO|nr:hypothetical protein HIM_12562 [Hirsutella minnesotensis 3608]
MSDKVPPLRKQDDNITDGKGEQAEEFLEAFFPRLPPMIEDDGGRPQRRELRMHEMTMQEVEEKVMTVSPWKAPGEDVLPPIPRLPPVIEDDGGRPQRRELRMHEMTMQEVEEKIMTVSPWKAPGEDVLPPMVWKQLWPVVKDRVLHLFQTSLRDGKVPSRWRNAKIISLKKPDKGDYSVAKAWRPMPLLSTLGKILEAVGAERISFLVEKPSLLPANHFGARKKRSAEQALLLLQEKEYNTWRSGKVLSLISFDVKGAYNGESRSPVFYLQTTLGPEKKKVGRASPAPSAGEGI